MVGKAHLRAFWYEGHKIGLLSPLKQPFIDLAEQVPENSRLPACRAVTFRTSQTLKSMVDECTATLAQDSQMGQMLNALDNAPNLRPNKR